MRKYKDYKLKFLPKTLQALKAMKPMFSNKIELPLNTIIHYISDTCTDYGIRRTHPLLQENKNPVRILHVLELLPIRGNPKKKNFNAAPIYLKYYKSRPSNFNRIRKMQRTIKEARSVLVMDYSLLHHTHRYTIAKTHYWDEFYNLHNTMWHGIAGIGTSRQNFIAYKIPELLPPYRYFKTVKDPIPVGLLKKWKDNDALGLLYIWNLIEKRDIVSREVAENVTLVFTESNRMIQVNLGLLFDYAEDDVEKAQRALYAAWVTLFEVRTGLDSHAVADVTSAKTPPAEAETIGANNLNETIKELVDAGKLSGAQQKRIWKLSETYKTIPNPNGKGSLADLAKVKSPKLKMSSTVANLPDKIGIVDKTMLRTTINNFDKDYVEGMLESDVAGAVLQIQNAGVLVRDYKTSHTIDALNDYTEYSVSVTPINGSPSTIKFKLPTVKANGEFIANGVKYRLDNQRCDLPIRKVAPDRVALTSYYGKAFVSRSGKAVSSYSRWIIGKLTKLTMDSSNKVLSNLVFSTLPIPKANLPRGYTAISGNIVSFIARGLHFNFAYQNRKILFPEATVTAIEAKTDMVVCGNSVTDKNTYLVMDEYGVVYKTNTTGTLTSIGTIPTFIEPEWGEGPVEYTAIKVYGKAIPVGIVLSYLLGLNQVLKTLKVKHRWVPSGTTLNLLEGEVRVRFKDESLVYDSRDRKASLLLGGFNGYKRAIVTLISSDFNSKNNYGFLLEQAGIGRHILKEITLMNKMFIDPITLELLSDMGEPTIFTELLYRSTELLLNDNYTDEMDSSQMRIRGYERFSGFIYKRLVDSVREQRNSENPIRNKVNIPDRAVWADILSDPSIILVEESNPIHNLKEKEGVTFTGQGGRTAETMVGSSRLFHENDMGTFSESTPDSARVGIKAYMSPNAKLNSLRGTSDRYNPKVDGITSLLSTTAMLSPAATHMDPKRVNMGSVQQSSMVSAAGGHLTPVRTGYEQVIAIRCDDRFAYNAKGPGKVTAVSDKYIEIEFTDENSETKIHGIKLGTTHGKAAGAIIPHTIVTDLTVGNRFKSDDIIAWNDGYFERDILNPGGVSMKGGVIARTTLMENTDTLEDGSAISHTLSEKLATPVTKSKTILVGFDQAVGNLVKIGDDVSIDSILATIEEGEIDSIAEGDDALLGLVKLTGKVPKAKFKGTVSDIEVIYMGSIDDMHDSLKKIARADSRKRIAHNDATHAIGATTGEITESTFISGNKVVNDTMVITIFMDSIIPNGIGDKSVFDNALKTITGRIMEGTNKTEDGKDIDAIFGFKSISNRMTSSTVIVGTTNSALIALSEKVVEAYRN